MPLPCQPAARSRPLASTRTQIRSCPRVGLALLVALLMLTGRGGAASSQPATRYASRIVETKSGQIRGILQVCIDSSYSGRGISGRREGEERRKEEESEQKEEEEKQMEQARE